MLAIQDRVRPLEGVNNFRDYGGYAADGGHVKTGRFYRSGQHMGATPDDLSVIGDYGFETVIDLRGDAERAQYPCARPEGFAATVLFAPGETAGTELAPHEQAAQGTVDVAEAIERMVLLYSRMPYRPALIEAMRHYFDTIELRDGPSLVHCVAGKDRTGLTVALFHLLLGVHRDDAYADYLLTNQAADIDKRLPTVAPEMRARYGATLSDAAIRTLLGVDERYLDAALASISASHGSVAAYADDVLGVTPARQAAIRARSVA